MGVIVKAEIIHSMNNLLHQYCFIEPYVKTTHLVRESAGAVHVLVFILSTTVYLRCANVYLYVHVCTCIYASSILLIITVFGVHHHVINMWSLCLQAQHMEPVETAMIKCSVCLSCLLV